MSAAAIPARVDRAAVWAVPGTASRAGSVAGREPGQPSAPMPQATPRERPAR